MRLTRLRLRNWKAFRSLDLELGISGKRNVFIIEGSNGFGKTSLLEAIILALYGREGVALVGRASSRGRAELGYDAFLERALHQAARGSDASASVELSFEGEGDDERVTLQRIWHFNPAGRHRKADEELRLWTGADDDLVVLPEGPEREVEGRDFVGRALVPARLASFFLFDGEHLDRLAGRDLDQQVRLGLEHALGIPVLRRLGEDLKTYARDRRRLLAGTAGADIDALIDSVADHEREQKRIRAELEQVNQRLVPLREERDSIVARIGSLHGESYESFKLLFEERERRARMRDGLQDRLRQTLSFDLALALAGPSLRAAAREAIASDIALAQSTSMRAAGAGRYDALIKMLSDPDDLAEAGLSSAQWKAFEPRLRHAWARVWGDASGGGSDPLHDHLGESDRLLVDERLRQIEAFGVEAIAELAHEAEAADATVAGIDRQIADQRGIDDISQQLADRLRETQAEISGLEEQARSLTRDLESLDSELGTKDRALAKARSEVDADAPLLARADRADAVNRVLARLIDELFPLNLAAFAKELTNAYTAMTHKGAVKDIRIDESGRVTLLDQEGRDLSELDPSAGESQIFAFALMAAITRIAPPFPIVLDTPLARLDPEHRDRVLRYFAGLDQQIIFLSQPAELSERYIELLEPHLAARIRLEHRAGESRPADETVPQRRASV